MIHQLFNDLVIPNFQLINFVLFFVYKISTKILSNFVNPVTSIFPVGLYFQ